MQSALQVAVVSPRLFPPFGHCLVRENLHIKGLEAQSWWQPRGGSLCTLCSIILTGDIDDKGIVGVEHRVPLTTTTYTSLTPVNTGTNA
jgi:hypothetical protein